MPVTLDLEAARIDEVLESFDRLRVERSSLAGGPFTEVTHPGDEPTAASLLGTQSAPFVLDSLVLLLSFDGGATQTVTFAGSSALTIGQVVSQVNAQIGVEVASNDSGRLRLTSRNTGSGSSIRVVGGTAIAVLGFTTDQQDIGFERWIRLVQHQTVYQISDEQGSVAATYYRTYYYNSQTGQSSTYSAVFLGSSSQVLSGTSLSLATVDLVDLQGQALKGQKLYIVPVRSFELVSGQVVDAGKRINLVTDGAGHAEVSLVRGAQIRVVFEATGIVRQVTVPDQSTFDLVTLMSAAQDRFGVTYPNLPAAPSRSV